MLPLQNLPDNENAKKAFIARFGRRSHQQLGRLNRFIVRPLDATLKPVKKGMRSLFSAKS